MDLSRLSPDSSGSQEGRPDYVPPSRTHQYKKLMKPLMERKRRARMNVCIEEIRDLIAGQLGRPGAGHAGHGADAEASRAHADDDLVSRMDKAEVLELAVKHIHKQLMASRRPDPYTELKMFQQGYMSARAVISDYLHCSAEADPAVLRRLNSHLDRLGRVAGGGGGPGPGAACLPAPLRLLPQPGQLTLPASPAQLVLPCAPPQLPPPPPPPPPAAVQVSLPLTRAQVTLAPAGPALSAARIQAPMSASRAQVSRPPTEMQVTLPSSRTQVSVSRVASATPARAGHSVEPRSAGKVSAGSAPRDAPPSTSDGPINLSKSAFKPVLSKRSSPHVPPVSASPADVNSWRPW